MSPLHLLNLSVGISKYFSRSTYGRFLHSLNSFVALLCTFSICVSFVYRPTRGQLTEWTIISMQSQSDNEKTSRDESKTEAVVSDSKADDKCYIPRCGLVFYIMAFFGFFCAFALRVSLSVAIVAMVNQTAITEDVPDTNTSGDTGQCPRDAALLRAGGEFVWDRNQQGALLAAFYYGHELTQVLSIRYISYFTSRHGINSDTQQSLQNAECMLLSM